MIEVELKAWADLEAARKKLEALGKTLGKTTVKEDVYYCAPEADPRTCDARRDRIVRVRIAGGEALVTAKRKRVQGGVETSEEIEFAASSADAVRALLDYQGYRTFLRKSKESRTYRWSEGVTVELNRLAGLGDFVEIEALVPEGSSRERVDAARDEVRDVARALGVEQQIEGRPYMDLLRERRVGIE